MYMSHKKGYGIKFQSVVTLDGLFASTYGQVNGSRHNSFLLSNSDLLNKRDIPSAYTLAQSSFFLANVVEKVTYFSFSHPETI